MLIRKQEIEVDVKAELEEFEWERAKWQYNKLICCSPYRSGEDRRPSFFVRLIAENGYEAGIWSDSGATDDYLAKGNFVKLLAFLRNETEPETEEYLLETYGGDVGYKKLTLNLDLAEEKSRGILPGEFLQKFDYNYDYLSGRGISESVQKLVEIKFDSTNKCAVIPWYNHLGELANVKYRKVDSKLFWYEKEGTTPIRDLVWGLNIIYQKNCDYAVVTEAEIDSMTLLTAGIPSIALGGASLSAKKRELLVKSPLKRIYIATDQDEVGKKVRRQLIKELSAYKEIYTIDIPARYKDVNDVREKALLWGLLKNSKKVESFFMKFG